MNELQILILSGILGGATGIFFFGGLWWTIRRAMTSRHTASWIFASLIVRMSVVVAAFWFMGHNHWQRLLACLTGFVIGRIVVMRLTGLKLSASHSSSMEAKNAS